MTKDDAIRKLQHSLATEEARVITPKGKVYKSYVEELAKSLMASVIAPVKVTVTSTCAAEGDFAVYQKSVVWGIVRNGDSWLLTLEVENEFALGFGDDPSNVKMLGFSSPDALGEWCA